MKKNILIAILGVAVVALLAVVLWPNPSAPDRCPTCGKAKVECEQGCTHNPCLCQKETKHEKLSSITNAVGPVAVTNLDAFSAVESEDVVRLIPQRIRAVSEVTGHGSYSKLCYKSSGDFHYVHMLLAESRILDRNVAEDGFVEVEEERTFLKSREMIDLDHVDAEFSLEQVPLDDIEAWAIAVSKASSVVSLATASAPWVSAAALITGSAAQVVEFALKMAHAMEGESIRGQFEKRGLPVPKWIERIMKSVGEKEAMKRMEQFHGHIQRLEGSAYRFHYWQNGAGKPMNVTYRRADGGPLSKEEREVLDSVNVFLDSKLMPRRDIQVGEEWSVDARDLEQLVGTATGGKLSGELRLRRLEDSENTGLWSMEVLANRLRVKDEKGRPSGALVIAKDGGGGLFDPQERTLRSMKIIGSGRLNVETMRKVLFIKCITRSDGECTFRSAYVSQPLDEAEAEEDVEW